MSFKKCTAVAQEMRHVKCHVCTFHATLLNTEITEFMIIENNATFSC